MSHRVLATLCLIAFVTLAVFGFVAMLSDMGGNHADCLASIANNGCPVPQSGPAMAVFHVTAYQAFSTAIIIFAILLLIVFGAFISGFFQPYLLKKSRWKLLEKLSWQFTNFNSIIRQSRKWHSLLEKRDPALAF